MVTMAFDRLGKERGTAEPQPFMNNVNKSQLKNEGGRIYAVQRLT